jgi:nicotinamide phosphoribosyltransferase
MTNKIELKEKLSEVFQINPLYEADGYKPGHIGMLAPGATRLYGTMIPRTFKYMPGGIDKLMCAGPQLTVRYIHSAFSENFFYTKSRYLGKSVFSKAGNATLRKKALKFAKDLSLYFNAEYSGKHFEDLWDLGYLPVEFKALPEGIFTDANIPHMTFINTVDGYAWLTLFLETIVSKLSWQMPIAATIGHKYRQNANEAVAKTNKKDMWLAEFMCHDFHSRGGNPFTSIAVGLGHAASNKGSDTLNVIPSSRYYYDEDDDSMPIFSVLASEHSVTCTQLFYYQDRLKRGLENETIKALLLF